MSLSIKNEKNQQHPNNKLNSNKNGINKTNPYLYSQLKNVFNEHRLYCEKTNSIGYHKQLVLQKNVKNKCKSAVYKLKGLLKRKLKNSTVADEDLYVEVINACILR